MDGSFSPQSVPPKWVDGNECHCCGKAFSLFIRQNAQTQSVEMRGKHHCRYCGNVFCNGCSSPKQAIPEFGYVYPVRVCLLCHKQIRNRMRSRLQDTVVQHLPKRQSRTSWTSDDVPEPSAPPLDDESDAFSSRVSPPPTPPNRTASPRVSGATSELTKADLDDLNALLSIFTTRLHSNRVRDRSIVNDSAVHSMFASLRAYLPRLLAGIRGVEQDREHLEGLQDRLVHILDARAALDALRLEHQTRKQQEEQERMRQHQQQMKSRLEKLRNEKQMAMMRQSQEACLWLREREAEMARRQEEERRRLMLSQLHHRFPYSAAGLRPPDVGAPLPPQPMGHPAPRPPPPQVVHPPLDSQPPAGNSLLHSFHMQTHLQQPHGQPLPVHFPRGHQLAGLLPHSNIPQGHMGPLLMPPQPVVVGATSLPAGNASPLHLPHPVVSNGHPPGPGGFLDEQPRSHSLTFPAMPPAAPPGPDSATDMLIVPMFPRESSDATSSETSSIMRLDTGSAGYPELLPYRKSDESNETNKTS